jgi:hypothetical protein
MRLSALLATLALSASAEADMITCHFTEPYITVAHSTAEATVVVSGLGIETTTYEDVGLTLTGVNALALTWADRRLDMRIDYRGSDQMSDQVYPISAQYGHVDQPAALHGGCNSTLLKKIIPADE